VPLFSAYILKDSPRAAEILDPPPPEAHLFLALETVLVPLEQLMFLTPALNAHLPTLYRLLLSPTRNFCVFPPLTQARCVVKASSQMNFLHLFPFSVSSIFIFYRPDERRCGAPKQYFLGYQKIPAACLSPFPCPGHRRFFNRLVFLP